MKEDIMVKEAIIAVCSTVIGTIVGWILGKINLGKLHIALSAFDEKYYYVKPNSMHIPGKQDHELYSAKLSFKTRLYNSSSISKAVHDFTLEFFDKSRNLILAIPVQDEESQDVHPYGANYKNIEVINVSAYESRDIKCVVWISRDDIDKMYQINSIRFRYSDVKSKPHYLKYKSIAFQDVPRFNSKEENGGNYNGQNENGNPRPDGSEH